ncbi:GNAT family N-acetyltransferase [Demequina aurantiaca]|uniref:GNAT family N-acetyltransferase n=1 Tax=Demequina aurantiaca TaxID=676200 RepID=UPI00078505D7|nr:GNAT family N-acetyltransferase [Demequina aurantiaca]
MTWPRAIELETERFSLEPLAVHHAVEMTTVLAPLSLYEYTGGEPPTVDSLRERYGRQSAGHSPADDAGWLNWIVRTTDTRGAIGYVQATLTHEEDELVADLAWLITPDAQRTGAASEAAAAMVTWLNTQEVRRLRAFIRPNHRASSRVAENLGLRPTEAMHDGERVWEASRGGAPANN